MSKEQTPAEPAETEKDEKEAKVVWMSCRATPGCKGNQAEMMGMAQGGMKIGGALIASGGAVVRYKCQTCNASFVIST